MKNLHLKLKKIQVKHPRRKSFNFNIWSADANLNLFIEK